MPTLAGTSGPILAIAISRDGKTLATGNEEGTARLWDIQTGQAIGAPLRASDAAPASSRATSRLTEAH